MKGVIKFLEDNNKWIVRIFIVIGIWFMYDLWSIGTSSSCGGGGYISLCIVPTLKYTWTVGGYISIIFFLLSLIIIYIIKKIKNKRKKLILGVVVLLLGLLCRPIFYIISPDFGFYYGNKKYEYMDKEKTLTDVDKYLYYMGKYCDNSIDDFDLHYNSRSNMCSYPDFINNIEDYKKIFDFANNRNMRLLYKKTYMSAEEFGLEKIIKGYNDDTFYGYLLYRGELDEEKINLLEKSLDNKFLKVIQFYNNFIYVNSQLLKNDKNYDAYVAGDKFNKEFYNKLKQIKTINTKVF